MVSDSLTEEIEECIRGAVDMHVHSAPDIIARKGNDIEFAKMARTAGMAGIVLKSHYVPTADRASLVNDIVGGVKVIGGITLNNSVGGINPQAVEVAGRSGAKVVWMPTVDSENEDRKKDAQNQNKLPYWAIIKREMAQKGFDTSPVKILDQDGNFVKAVHEVIERIKEHNMILATGHLSPVESIKLIKLASSCGLTKVVITHPEFPTTSFTLEEQQELCAYGVFFERCYTTAATGKTSWQHIVDKVKATGTERNILSTDLGQPNAPYPVEGIKQFVKVFLEHDFSVDDIRKMTVLNQEALLS